MTNNDWATTYLQLGPAFCSGDSRLIGTSNGQFYVAVGTPFKVSRAMFTTQTSIAPRMLIALLAIIILTCHLFIGDLIAQKVFGVSWPLAFGMAFIGLMGMAEIALFVTAPGVAQQVSAVATAVVAIAALVAALRNPGSTRRWLVISSPPLLLWTLVCVAYISLICCADNGGGNWAINNFFSPLRWSSDNQLPMMLTEAFYNGVPANQILFSPWNGFDRTPLMSGLLLPLRVVLLGPYARVFGNTLLPAGYMTLCIVLLSSWVLVLNEACRSIGLRRAGIFVIALAAVTPFFIFNSVFAWPKLIGGGFAVLTYCALLRMKERRRWGATGCVLAAVFAACSYLSHASNAIVVGAIALFFLPALARQRWRSLAVATLAFFLLMGGWTAFAAATQPHSNALLRFALANDFGMQDRTASIWSSVKVAYASLGWRGWLDLKINEALRLFLDLPYAPTAGTYAPRSGWTGLLRVGDFTTAGRSIGLASIAALGLFLVRNRLPSSNPIAHRAGDMSYVGFGALMLSIAVFLPPATTHQLPYGALMLLFLAGASAIDLAGRRAKIIVLTCASLYCLRIWVLGPIDGALRQDMDAQVVLGEAVVAFMIAAIPGRRFHLASRQMLAPFRSSSRPSLQGR